MWEILVSSPTYGVRYFVAGGYSTAEEAADAAEFNGNKVLRVIYRDGKTNRIIL